MSAQMYTYWPGTNSMEQSPSSEAGTSSSSKIPLSWWYLHVHYHTHKCQPPVSTLHQIHLIHASPSHLLEIHFAVILPSMPRSSKWFHSLRSPGQKTVHTSCLPSMTHAPPIWFMIWSREYLLGCTDNEYYSKICIKLRPIVIKHVCVGVFPIIQVFLLWCFLNFFNLDNAFFCIFLLFGMSLLLAHRSICQKILPIII